MLEAIPDGSVDAVITDPPYGTMNAGWDVQLNLQEWWSLIGRKLKPTGVAAVFACGKFLFQLQASNPKGYRYDLVWKKSRPAGFLNASHAPLRDHEYVLIFTPRLKAATYNPQKIAAKSPVKVRRFLNRSGHGSSLYGGDRGDFIRVEDGSRHPRSVLEFQSVKNQERLHPTQKPLDLLRWLVRTYSNAGDLVVDPFMGSGTTGEACLIEGRRFFGCERDAMFFKLAKKRLSAQVQSAAA